MKKNISTALLVLVIILAAWFFIAPPRFFLNLTRKVDTSDMVASGAALVEKHQCTSCHQINQEGRPFGPSLDGVTQRMEKDALHTWLIAPDKIKPGTAMPNFSLSDAEVDAIIAYLDSLQ